MRFTITSEELNRLYRASKKVAKNIIPKPKKIFLGNLKLENLGTKTTAYPSFLKNKVDSK